MEANLPIVKDPLHLLMEGLERIEGLPNDGRHHMLFMAAVLIGKLEETLGLPEISLSMTYDLILSWEKLQIVIAPQDPMFTVSGHEAIWAYVLFTPFEVVKCVEDMHVNGVPELPPDQSRGWISRLKNYLVGKETRFPYLVIQKE